MSQELLTKLEQAAKIYIESEKKMLNAEYDFLTLILKARGYSKITDFNNKKAGEFFIKSMQDFLES